MPSEHIHTVDPAGIVVYDPANYADYFVERPTKQDYARLQAERDRALSRPLKAGDVLDFEGPSLHPGALPPADYPAEPPEPSPHEPRPALAALLARNSPSRLGRGWALRLIDALQAGEDETAQVWRCEALRGNEAAGPVVLKLYHQALFEFPDPCESNPLFDGWNWIPASHKQEREAMAYRCVNGLPPSLSVHAAAGTDAPEHLSQLKAYQGRDLPLCYGFYRFVLPCGDAVVGVVLEDLVDEVTPLWDLIDQEERKRGFDMDKLDRLVRSPDRGARLTRDRGLTVPARSTDLRRFRHAAPPAESEGPWHLQRPDRHPRRQELVSLEPAPHRRRVQPDTALRRRQEKERAVGAHPSRTRQLHARSEARRAVGVAQGRPAKAKRASPRQRQGLARDVQGLDRPRARERTKQATVPGHLLELLKARAGMRAVEREGKSEARNIEKSKAKETRGAPTLTATQHCPFYTCRSRLRYSPLPAPFESSDAL